MDDYHLIQQIGEGSFGRVYKARRKYTGRLVAIKLINKLGQSKDDLLSFKREIEILKKVNHPHVMRMLNIFETDTDFCLVSELARGDLFQIIDDNQTLPEQILKSIALQLVSALAYLHKNRIIHRDMKPQNILIGARGTVKLCDFGFARALSYTTLFLNSIKGTPLYMAPELVQEQHYDEKIDAWSLGVILYELYYGQPPFYTNSIYKLIQMIVNDDIQWPGEISSDFKDFLLRMLQKNPENRASCEELLKHPFLSDLQLGDFDDRIYQFKSKQFEDAIQESFSDRSVHKFVPPKSKIPDYQSIFVNPSVRSPDELLQAVKYLRELKVSADSPLAASFSFHFSDFISHSCVIDEALIAATELLEMNYEKFSSAFAVGTKIFALPELPVTAVPFLTRLLSIPYSSCLVSYSEFSAPDLHLNTDNSERLRDRLLSFVFSSDSLIVEQTYALFAYLVQESEVFLSTLYGTFAPQFMPLVASAYIHHPSPIVKSSALCILTRIIDKDNSSINYIQPISQFLDVISSILNNDLQDIPSFCLFGSTVSFIAVSLRYLSGIPEFQRKFNLRSSLSNLQSFVHQIFTGNKGIMPRLASLVELGSQNPIESLESLSYIGILSSPFAHIPIDDTLVKYCVTAIPTLVPYHQPALLSTLFSLPPESIIGIIPDIVRLMASPYNSNCISEYITNVISQPSGILDKFINSLCEAEYLLMVIGILSELGPSIPPSVIYAWSQVILSFNHPSPLLVKDAPEILSSIFALDSAAETALMIAGHLARLSSEFIPILDSYSALSLAERAIQSEAVQIRVSSLGFIGNYCRRAPLPPDSEKTLFGFVLNQLTDTSQQCIRQATFALGNILLMNSQCSSMVMPEIDSIIHLLKSSDPKTAENSAGIIGNIARSDNSYIPVLIDVGALDALVETIEKSEELGGRCILQIAVFCLHESSIKHLRASKASSLISKFVSSPDQRVKKYANMILQSLKM